MGRASSAHNERIRVEDLKRFGGYLATEEEDCRSRAPVERDTSLRVGEGRANVGILQKQGIGEVQCLSTDLYSDLQGQLSERKILRGTLVWLGARDSSKTIGVGCDCEDILSSNVMVRAGCR